MKKSITLLFITLMSLSFAKNTKEIKQNSIEEQMNKTEKIQSLVLN